jgi:hypothetical protein
MEEEEDDIFENQPEFQVERNVWDRIGGMDIGLGLGGTINLKKSGYTISEKFRLIALVTITIINDLDFNQTLNPKQITHILENVVDRIPAFEYKNPSAFVMGYMVAQHSNYANVSIDKEALADMIRINREIREQLSTVIEDVDIVRYTRLCLLNKLK